MRLLARAASEQVAAASDPAAQIVLMSLVTLAGDASPGEEVDDLATELMSSPPSPDPVPFVLGVLRLPLGTAAAETVLEELGAFVEGAPLEQARNLAIGGRVALEAFGYDPLPKLIERWVRARGQVGQFWPWMPIGVGIPALLAEGLQQVASDDTFVELVEEAASTVASRADGGAAAELVRVIAGRVATMALSQLDAMLEALTELAAIPVDTSDVASALETRAIGEPGLGAFTTFIHRLADSGVQELRPTAMRLAERGAAAGGIPLGDVAWLVRTTNGTDAARRVVVRAIETETIDQVAELLSSVPALRRHSDIRLAAAVRARTLTAPDEVQRLLDAARSYRRPTEPEYQAAIDEVGDGGRRNLPISCSP